MANQEENKLEYAVKWRDRYIRELSAALAGREEEAALLAAFLKAAFARLCTDPGTCPAGELTIPKSEIAEGLRTYRTEVRDEGGAYRIRLVPGEKDAPKEREDAPEKNSEKA